MSKQELYEEVASLKRALSAKDEAMLLLQQELEAERSKNDKLNRMLFSATREKFTPKRSPFPLHPSLFGTAIIPEAPKPKAAQAKKEAQKRGGRKELPKQLPEEKKDLFPDVDRSRFEYIGQEKVTKVHYTPASLVKKVYYIHKFKDPDTGEIISAEAPKDAFQKCIAHHSLIAWILVAKHVDHLPLERIIGKIYREYGWKISKATMQSWIQKAYEKLKPLLLFLQSLILATSYLQADESGIKVQLRIGTNKKKWKLHRGQMWVYHDPIQRLVLFDYEHGRAKKHALEILEHFSGKLQTDAYAVYDSIAATRLDIILVGCNTHVRRKFHEALKNDRKNAEKVLLYYQQLYDIEAECRAEKLTHQQRQAKRMEECPPIMAKLKELLLALLDHTLPDQDMGKAVRHALKRWDYLQEYIYDGRLEICNNLVENCIRPLALGRKNYLFAGSQEGAKRLAMFLSLFATCKQNGVNPLDWLNDIFERIDEHSIQKLDELLPGKWKQMREAQSTQ